MMNPERWERVKWLVLEAQSCATEHRAGMLRDACADDPELHREVESLLANEERADAFLEGPKPQTAAQRVDPSRLVGQFVGGLRVLEFLGRGGMGVVYRARQQHPDREVALKIVPGGMFVDEHRLRLFQREIASLARLKHPFIATIHESGCTEDGQHYFAQELVEGVSLGEYLSTTRPSTRDRLQLFCRICDAINYAHQRGVIHRDLKPNNILVSSEGVPKVLDFGLAKITEVDVTATSIGTEIGRIQGTLAYMSPEQARGRSEDIDLRSDVYSLGIILYELLTQRRPHDLAGSSLTAAVQRICEEQPTRPALIDRSLRGDLETITLKALNKDPEQRYPTVAALSEDIERYLTNQPISARPQSMRYQLSMLIRRHKLPCALLATLCLVVLLGAGVSLGLWRQSRREAVTASTVSSFLLEMIAHANPYRAHGDEVTVLELLDAFDERVGRLKHEPEIEFRLRRVIGGAYNLLGLHEQSNRHEAAALTILKQLRGADHPEVADMLIRRGWSLHEQTAYDEAGHSFKEAMRIFERRDLQDSTQFARAQAGWADILSHQENNDAARRHALQALRVLEAGAHGEAAQTLVILSQIELALGDAEAATEYARRAMSVEQNRPLIFGAAALAQRQLATALLASERCSEAEALLAKTLADTERDLPAGHANIFLVRSLLGESVMCQGRFEEARLVLREIDVSAPGFSKLDDHERRECLDRLARAYERLGQMEEAATYRALMP